MVLDIFWSKMADMVLDILCSKMAASMDIQDSDSYRTAHKMVAEGLKMVVSKMISNITIMVSTKHYE